jgi:imidazolonepropionase-like amidohydrolase
MKCLERQFGQLVSNAAALAVLAATALAPGAASAQERAAAGGGALRTAAPGALLFEDVRVFSGTASSLSPPVHVLVIGNTIEAISAAPISPPAQVRVLRIAGQGRTLMPGLIDAHVHLTFGSLLMAQLRSPELTPAKAEAAAAAQAERMLLRGFTAVRDVGGPVFGLKRRIDAGEVLGPRIWHLAQSSRRRVGMATFVRPMNHRAASQASHRARSCSAPTS